MRDLCWVQREFVAELSLAGAIGLPAYEVVPRCLKGQAQGLFEHGSV